MSSRTFRIFVSSTFNDLKAERDALQREVFPKLRELCLQHGCRFQAIDLRWGVSKEASMDQRTMQICLKELRRCQEVTPRPNFIVLLGDRYGWRPLPAEIPAHEFEALLERLAPSARDLLLWQEGRPAESQGWYRLDNNAVPPVYYLRPRVGSWQDEAAWGPLERTLHDLLLKGIASLPLAPAARRRYQASATAQEIAIGALDEEGVDDAGEHVFCFCRTIDDLPQAAPAGDLESRWLLGEYLDLTDDGEVDRQAQRSLDCLRDNLAYRLPGHVFFYKAHWLGGGEGSRPPITTRHLEQLCDDAYQALSQVILAQIRLLGETSPQEQEIAAHESFGRERAAWFLGRREPLAAVMAYLEGDDPLPLAVLGNMGSGKSALLARALEICRRRWPQAAIISRFLGATPSSAQGRTLIEGLCRQLGAEGALPTEFHDLVRDFSRRLAQAGPIILFLDALDQLPAGDPARFLAWLPSGLPPQVRLVVSAQSPGDAANTLTRRLPVGHLVHLPPLPADEACELLALWLEAAGRTVTAAQWRAIMDGYARQGLPLYLKLAFEEARRWQSFTSAAALPGDVSGLIRHLFGRLSQDDHYGPLLVSRSLGYLAAARHGLSEDELLEVLSLDEDVMGEFFRRSYHDPPQPQLPVVVWARLFSDLGPYLMLRRADDNELLAFYHPQLGEEAAALFLPQAERRQRHRCLAAFFHDQPLRWREGDQTRPNRRRLSELPYQQTLGELQPELLETLTDLQFVETKAAAGLSYDLLADLDRALHKWDWPPLHQLRQALGWTVPWMAERPELALQFLFNRLSWAAPLDPALSTILPRWGVHLEARGLWLRAAAPLPGAGARSEVRLVLETPTGIQSLAPGGGALAAATAEGVVEVRDTRQGGLDRRRLPASGIGAVALREDRTVAFLTRAGVMGVETSDAVLAGRAGEAILASHPPPHHGLLGVAQNHSLVAWNPEENTVNVLAEHLPQPLIALRLTPDGEAALFVAGRRPQMVGLSRWDGHKWRTSTFTHEGPPVVDADLDPQGEQALLLCLDRSVKLVAAHDFDTPLAVLRYETRPDGLQGQPQKVRFGRGESAGWAFFATVAGHLACWRWQEDLVVRLEDFRRGVTDLSFLAVFEVMPDTGRLFYSTETFGREISLSDDHRSASGHLVTVAACLLTDSGKVVSLSELEQTVRWSTAEGLTPLACQTFNTPTALASRPGSDEVFMGNSQGLFWVQSPHRHATSHDLVQVLAEPLVSLVPLSSHQVLAAGKGGRIMKLNLKKERFERVWSGTGFRQQKKILPAGRAGICWSLYQEEMAGYPLVISLVTGVNRERVVLKTEKSFVFLDAAVSPDGASLALAGEMVEVFRLVRQGLWRRPALTLQHRRQTTVKWAAFLGQGDLLAVILADSPWLEVWGVEEGLPTVAAAELPGEASCLAARGHRLVVGFASGDLMSLALTGNPSP